MEILLWYILIGLIVGVLINKQIIKTWERHKEEKAYLKILSAFLFLMLWPAIIITIVIGIVISIYNYFKDRL